MNNKEPLATTQTTPQTKAESMIDKLNLPRTIHMVPLDIISGFEVRPGFY